MIASQQAQYWPKIQVKKLQTKIIYRSGSQILKKKKIGTKHERLKLTRAKIISTWAKEETKIKLIRQLNKT